MYFGFEFLMIIMFLWYNPEPIYTIQDVYKVTQMSNAYQCCLLKQQRTDS